MRGQFATRLRRAGLPRVPQRYQLRIGNATRRRGDPLARRALGLLQVSMCSFDGFAFASQSVNLAGCVSSPHIIERGGSSADRTVRSLLVLMQLKGFLENLCA